MLLEEGLVYCRFMRILNTHLELYQEGMELWETFLSTVTQAMVYCYALDHQEGLIGGHAAEFDEMMQAIRVTGGPVNNAEVC